MSRRDYVEFINDGAAASIEIRLPREGASSSIDAADNTTPGKGPRDVVATALADERIRCFWKSSLTVILGRSRRTSGRDAREEGEEEEGERRTGVEREDDLRVRGSQHFSLLDVLII